MIRPSEVIYTKYDRRRVCFIYETTKKWLGLKVLRESAGDTVVQRIIPANKGVRCVACDKQMLHRGLMPLPGEHDFEDYCPEIDEHSADKDKIIKDVRMKVNC
jgi:hypothetical protein